MLPNLPSALERALADMGFEAPTPIQERAYPVIKSGKDVVGIAQTGTGKTVAFLLPLLTLWKFRKDRFPQVLIMAPTRELVVQISGELERLTQYMNVVTVPVYGGVNIKTQAAEIDGGCDFVVGTPGRVYDLVVGGILKFRALRHFVIDEVDEMLELGFRPQLERVIDRLPERRQNLLFSATMTRDVERVIADTFDFPVTVEAAPTGTPLDNIRQFGYPVPNFYTKINLLSYLLADRETYTRTLVFAPNKRLADLMAERLEADFPGEVGVIHGNKSQNYRFRSLEEFAGGTTRVLIATDIISRGIDLTGVSHVISVDTPEERENYIHRIGRTGRADREGVSITFVTEDERPRLERIEAYMDRTLSMRDFPAEVEVDERLLPEEEPGYSQPQIDLRPDVVPGKAFQEKKESNKKEQLTRRQLQEVRRRRGMRSKKKRRK